MNINQCFNLERFPVETLGEISKYLSVGEMKNLFRANPRLVPFVDTYKNELMKFTHYKDNAEKNSKLKFKYQQASMTLGKKINTFTIKTFQQFTYQMEEDLIKFTIKLFVSNRQLFEGVVLPDRFIAIDCFNWFKKPQIREKMSKIKNFSLTDQNIRIIPPQIRFLKNLEYLDLQNNKLHCVTKRVCCLNNLKALILKNNKLQKLPQTFNNLKLLETLNLDNNLFSEQPNVKELKNLQNFSWQGNLVVDNNNQ